MSSNYLIDSTTIAETLIPAIIAAYPVLYTIPLYYKIVNNGNDNKSYDNLSLNIKHTVDV